MRTARSRRAGLLAAAVGSAGLVGCATVSARYVVESDMRFEHCYRIDEDPRVSVGDKRLCWTEWREHYERGQDPNRITYVDERLHVLDGAAATGGTATPTIAAAHATGCPLPNSPYVPPPPVVSTAVTVGMTAAPPDPTCSDGCNREWKTCSPVCNGDTDCLGKCDGKLRTCMKACFQ